MIPTSTRRSFLGALAATPVVVAGAAGAGAPSAQVAAAPNAPAGAPTTRHRHRARLTKLDHLRFLLDDVPLVEQEAHTTYRIQAEPAARAPWTYADADGSGGYRRVGGGSYDEATGYYGQGAFNADDISRAAVVCVRHWQATGESRSREDAHQLLRALTYLQDSSGPNAGRVVLWQQFDGTLNPSADPVELPDPSDSAESYWLGRTVWALGEGYAAFRHADPAFARFLRERLHLAIGALESESLSRYGHYTRSDGRDLPDWLITGGTDATAEAVLGLVAYCRVRRDDARATRALRRYARGIEAMATADPQWPFGAILPWTGSLGFWHAWGGAAPEAAARAGSLLGRRELVRAALADAGTFTPLLLATGGPDNAWAPTPAEAQIAYGAQGRVAGALAAAEAGGGAGLRKIAGLAAGWFFGANRAGVPAYDPATGATVDGIETDGRVNRNSGAESTIHGLLTMLALDANPDVAAVARSATGMAAHHGLTTVNAEESRFSSGTQVVQPDGGAWTGEGNLLGGGYLEVPAGEWVELDLDLAGESLVYPIVWRRAEDAGVSRWSVVGGRSLGSLPNGGTGAQGLTEAPGALVPLPLDRPVGPGRVRLRCVSGGELRLDGLLLRPVLATAHYTGTRRDTVLYVSAEDRTQLVQPLAGGDGTAYTATGRRRGRARAGRRVRVVGHGFTVTA